LTLVDTTLDGDALLRMVIEGPPNGIDASSSTFVTLSPLQTIPEPGAASLLLLGLPALWWGGMRLRRRLESV
jgi:hypothetical protein